MLKDCDTALLTESKNVRGGFAAHISGGRTHRPVSRSSYGKYFTEQTIGKNIFVLPRIVPCGDNHFHF